MLMWVRRFVFRIQGLLGQRRLDRDFDQEVNAHLAMLVEENLRRGMPMEEAARQARLQFGGVTQIKESHRERRGLPQASSFLQDIRYGWRMLLRSPAFTLVAVLTLALGIGVNTLLFTAFDAIALKPLPVRDPDSVVRLMRWFASRSQGNGQYFFSYPEYLYYRDHSRFFSRPIAASWLVPVIAGSETLHGQLVSENYFSDLGIDAALGRTFLPEENTTRGAHPVIVLSYPYWRLRFNTDPAVLGKTLQLNDTIFTIAGVTPQEFIGTGNPPQVPDFWAPLMMQRQLAPGQDWLRTNSARWFQIFGRLEPGAGIRQVQAEANVMMQQFQQSWTPADKTVSMTVEHATFFGETNDIRFQALVVLLMVLVGMVLLIACANLANMLLARAANRQREIGVRLAMGASRRRVVRQLLTESALLSLLGGVAGLLLSIWAGKALSVGIEQTVRTFVSGRLTLAIPLVPDLRVFGYTLLVSLVTGILFGLAPALQFTRPDVAGALKDEGSGFGRFQRSRLRNFLLTTQVAISMILLVAGGLLVRGLVRSDAVETGYETRSVYMLDVNFNSVDSSYGSDPLKARDLYRQAVQRLRNSPGVENVALSSRIPLLGTWTPRLRVDETRASASSLPEQTLANSVSPDYFATLGIPLLRGRLFTRAESETRAPVAIVSDSAARRLWPGEDPIGKRAKLDLNFNDKWTSFEVIGVATDVRNAQLSRIDPAFFYLPTKETQWNNILIRGAGGTKSMLAIMRATLGPLDKNLLPDLNVISLEDGPVHIQRLMARTYASFAVMLASLALILAGVGIYGVMAYLVSQRTREIGIRMALGAKATDVVASILRQGLRPVLIGAVLGLAGAAGLSAILRAILVFPGSPDLLYGVSPADPATFLGLTAFLALVALVASAIPARRATRVDPMIALRYE